MEDEPIMMSLWRKKTLLTICFVVAASAGICAAQEPVEVDPEAIPDLPAPAEPSRDAEPPTQSSLHDVTAPSAGPVFKPVLAPSDSGAASTAPPYHRNVQVRYVIEQPVVETIYQNGEAIQMTRYVREVQSIEINVDANLDELDLPADGKRSAVLAVTAARHEGLLQKLKEAQGDEEKMKEAADALKTNYTEHYAIETWWREQRLAELEKRLKEMRDQVQQRQDAQEKYVDAAMTIAELWAQGIAIAPPKPGSAPGHGPVALPDHPATVAPTTGAVWSPATYTESQPPISLPPTLAPSPEPLTPIPEAPVRSRK